LNARPATPLTWDPKLHQLGCWGWASALAVPALATTLILGLGLLSGLGSVVTQRLFERAKARLEDRLGALEPRRFTPPEGCADPTILAEQALSLRLRDDEVDLLREWAASATVRVPERLEEEAAPLVERNTAVLDAFARFLEDEPRCLDLHFDDPESPIPEGFGLQVRLLRLEYLRSLLDLRRGVAETALSTVRVAGRHAVLMEGGPSFWFHIIGLEAEKLQLRLISQLDASGLVEAARLASLESELLDNDLRAQWEEALALESNYTYVGIQQILQDRLREKDLFGAEEGSLRTFAEWSGDTLAYYMGAGALDWHLRYAEAYDWTYREQKEELDYDPDEMSFLEKAGLVGSLKRWWLPSRYRVVADARELARLYLTGLAHLSELGGCDELQEVLPKQPLMGRLRVDAPTANRCVLDYTLRQEYEEIFDVDLAEEIRPPLTWSLALEAGGSPER
jgi:hypothetical protein